MTLIIMLVMMMVMMTILSELTRKFSVNYKQREKNSQSLKIK